MNPPLAAHRLWRCAPVVAWLFFGSAMRQPLHANDCLPHGIVMPDWSVQLARLDSDGWPDLLLVHRPTAICLRLRGSSTGTFAAPDFQQLDGVEPLSARTFVLTRDGRDDVVLLAHGISALETRLTETTGRLRTPVRTYASFHPIALDVGDVTMDGFEDVVVTWLLRPLISLHRSLSGTLQPIAFLYPSPRNGLTLTALDVAIVPWIADPRPEVAVLALREDGHTQWLLNRVRDLGAQYPPIEFTEAEAIEFERSFRQMDRFRGSPSAAAGLLLWDPGHADIVSIVPGPPSQAAELSLVLPPAVVASADLNGDSLDDLVVLDATRAAVQVYGTLDGVPILALHQPLPQIAETISLLPTGPGLQPQLWVITEPTANSTRQLLRFAVTTASVSLLQTYLLPPLQSPWGSTPNVLVETHNVPASPEASPAQKWSAGMGDWTVGAAFTDSAHLQADVRTWNGPHILIDAEPYVAALPTTVSLGPSDRIEVNGADPAQSQVFLGKTHALYDTPITLSPIAGYHPAPLDARVHFLEGTYPMHYLTSVGPPPELNWSDEGTIPISGPDLLCVVGARGLQVGPVLPYAYSIGPRPGPDRDSDGDGLSDAWELFFFGSLVPTAEEDPDLDLFSNGAEHLAITHPLNAASNPDQPVDPPVPPELSLTRQAGELVLSWLNDAGVSYTVQSAPIPGGPWTDRALLLPDPTPDIVRQWRQALADLSSLAAYRVLAIR